MSESNYYWDNRINYLKESRILYFNDDYLEFIVKNVWEISKPVTIIDFGCGTGYLGIKLMPFLPKESKYIGLDKGEKLLTECKKLFSNLPFESEFHQEDITCLRGDYSGDIVINQALLQHVENPTEVLKTMKKCTKANGIIASINPMWISSMANLYVKELDTLETADLGILQRIYEHMANNGQTNGQLGLKAATLLSEIGLKDVECRVSDKVNYIHPNQNKELHSKLIMALKNEGFGDYERDEEKTVARLTDMGISEKDSHHQYNIQKKLNEFINKNSEIMSLLWSCSLMISYGYNTL